tara:strand:+ start:224 stop:541 length:318 start_codon:yes stop_codon:yes gene_type:complete
MDSNSSIYPFYRVFTEKGEQYCDCGWEKHAQELVILNKDVQPLYYERVDAPKPINPETVDVNVTPTEELPGQQGLPQAVERLPFEPELEELPESPLETFIPGFHD